MTNEYFQPSFVFFSQEGYLIKTCLTSGLTHLRAANFVNKGAYYASFFNLSIGLERLLKCILIMDHMLKNDFKTPSQPQIKNYGHNLLNLYNSIVSVGENWGMALDNVNSFNLITKEIFALLCSFGIKKRYYNLDALSGSQQEQDPLEHWAKIIEMIIEADVPKRTIQAHDKKGEFVKFFEDISFTMHYDLKKDNASLASSFLEPGLQLKVSKYAVAKIIMLIRSLRALIKELSNTGFYTPGSTKPPFPLMHEFLDFAVIDDVSLLRKKRWP